MSKNTQTSGLVNYIAHSGSIVSVSGSLTVTGSLNVTGGITGSFQGVATTASYVLNAVSASFATTASYAVSASVATNAVTASYVLNAVSASFATTAVTSSFANAFTVAGTLTATTLVVQTITSSVDFVTGSTRFGSSLANTHAFTGSVGMTGSLAVIGGNVGIGTASPQAKFQVGNGTQGGINLADNKIHIATTGTRSALLTLANSSGGTTVEGQFESSAESADLKIVIGSASNHDVTLRTNNTERMRITSGGNVGIGTTSPVDYTGYRSLHIMGASSTSSAILYLTNSTSTIRGLFFAEGTANRVTIGSQSTHDFTFLTNDTERMRITSGGNVLIGTTTDAGYKLDVNGQSNLNGYNLASSFQFTRAASDLVQPSAGNGILVFAGGNAQMRMNTSNQICFDMYNSGNPHTVLTLKQSDNTVSINSQNNNLMLELKYQNVASGYLGASGSALYAYSTNGGYVLLNASSAWVPVSDVKRKRNFETYSLGLNAILGLKPKLYNMDFQKDGDDKQLGLVAQEVKEYIPLAFEQNGTFIGLNYNSIIVTMVNAIQELSAKNEALIKRIETLENK